MQKNFNTYADSFLTGSGSTDKNITLKKNHTRRVCLEIITIAEESGFSEHTKFFCAATALFHDIGRFEQYARFKTFVDADSTDHAVLGCEIIDKENFLGGLPPDTQDLIKKAILYHNRLKIPGSETQSCIFFSQLLRDADKLDIWNVLTAYYLNTNKENNTALSLGLPDTPGISDKVYQTLMNQETVLKEDLKNQNDFKLMQIGWVYDLNSAPAFRRLKEKGYLKKIREVLPQNNEQIEIIYSKAETFLERQIESR
jgi:hypothetical protein